MYNCIVYDKLRVVVFNFLSVLEKQTISGMQRISSKAVWIKLHMFISVILGSPK